MISRFEDAIAWKKAMELSVNIYELFKGHNDYSFRDQIQRAAVSVMNNIAEGFERRSNKEFQYFLYVAKGSSGEVRSMLHLAIGLKMVSISQGEDLISQSEEVSRIISGLIRSLKRENSN